LKGDKIPVLNETTVGKQDKSYKRSVTIFTAKKEKVEIMYGFMGNGSIKLEIRCPSSLTVNQIDQEFLAYDKILSSVSGLMYTSGFVYPKFTTIRDTVIEDMEMYSSYNSETKQRKCANPFFVGSGDDARYKRVSGFDENELITEICIDYYNHGEDAKIAPFISQIMGIDLAESRKIAEKRIREIESSLQTNPKKRFVIKNRIGFLSSLIHKNNEIRITVSGINSFYYMDSIQRNMNAYIAFQENSTVQCQDTSDKVVLKPFAPSRRYDDYDSETDTDDELESKPKESKSVHPGSDSEEELESKPKESKSVHPGSDSEEELESKPKESKPVHPGSDSEEELESNPKESKSEVHPGSDSEEELESNPKESKSEVHPGSDSEEELRPGSDSEEELRPGSDSEEELE
jgi:hypothetical protein